MTTSTSTPAVLDRDDTHLPGDGAMWVMVLGDLAIFGAYFIVYMVHRAMAPQAFLSAQQHLDVTVGVVNTMVLLTSSWLVARSLYATRAGSHREAIRLIYAGGACGVLFIAIKAYEWSTELLQGHTVSNEFFSFYYVLTGVHMFHVALGLIILGVCVRELRSPLRRRVSLVEQGATYWHMVDLLWVAIFGLLYVMR
ncbi:cytochrome C oxidase subunit III [Mycolicibacterium moriokaense]|uniref:Probable cytochrome c oxidase subunit 3 n=1 Tax=Mycolicibacterium moriokaense TaxID=39691 RepID=A0AAD1HHN7_9MYCO|nr:cytochrome c oxidase subunit 3 [Mycolicibacterium moriokaense]MCV7042114.1 cytochrome c oxidase subunit 3 [Mycolicibacterium moriokaense]ORB25182.1 cytochrome C oxidase subunit III [Mycolicibacterium moriokaense]BBX04884.1 cytochrome c oxidase subunit III [Mycolicibacterium moriokaense]